MVWGKVVSTFRRIKLDPYFIPQTHINPKYIKILNIRPEGVKLPDKSIREKLYNIGMADNVFDINLKGTNQTNVTAQNEKGFAQQRKQQRRDKTDKGPPHTYLK